MGEAGDDVLQANLAGDCLTDGGSYLNSESIY
ncbi:hypothetical protein AmaxDRAFT_0251 [Limnospira maxima CS-328]|uniref:Uncharacterized protein n=1 Tax=Limnospira maxima CS-328 TaxID=513049 RepID=B5VUK6_LIMMA|nr:hypothetical protein AmaxDRAFT_0251 [Limnospira maxima CS-328]